MIRARYAASAVLAAISALHLAWARGSSFPFGSADALADAVVGSPAVPSSSACLAVAAALAVASGLVAGAPVVPRPLRRPGIATVTTVLTVRGVAGLAGRTDLLSPGQRVGSVPSARSMLLRALVPRARGRVGNRPSRAGLVT